MKKYIKLFEEENSLQELTDISLVDKIIEFFKENPYPKDHSQLHKFAESLGLEADVVEQYVYAIVSTFISGGYFNMSGKSEDEFSEEEMKMGIEVEKEHVDFKNENEVVKHIGNFYRKRIALDHLAELSNYYTLLNRMEKSGEKI